MDRRDFFKTILATPVLAPILLASNPTRGDEIFLLADQPEEYLPQLLEILGRKNIISGHGRFSLTTHPLGGALSHALKESGWTPAPHPQKADLAISFRPLHLPAAPSFTMIRDGHIWDIRTKELYSLWQKMNAHLSPSSCLTVASLRAKPTHRAPGNTIRVYHNGQIVDDLPLKKDLQKTFRNDGRFVTVKIEHGKVFVPSSSCRHKICSAVPPVSFAGDRIVCAPNHFLLEVKGPRSVDTVIG